MGKVASTAIASALRRAGLAAVQAHIASPERIQQKLEIMTSATVDDAVAQRMYVDYLQELEVTFTLARRRVSTDTSGAPLRVLTLTRDPMTWYWSNFAQNYDHNVSLLRRYHAHHHGSESAFLPDVALAEIQQTLFRVIDDTRCPLDSAEALPQLMAEADALDPSNVVFSQLNRFLLPLRWFDEDFLPATGVDVYSHPFDAQAGWGRIDAPGLSVLVLRYENLEALTPQIAAFVGLPEIELRADNTSEDKDIPIDLRAMRERAHGELPLSLKERIAATRYARHFDYGE